MAHHYNPRHISNYDDDISVRARSGATTTGPEEATNAYWSSMQQANTSSSSNKTTYYGVLHRVDGQLTNRYGKLIVHPNEMIYYGINDQYYSYPEGGGDETTNPDYYYYDNVDAVPEEERCSYKIKMKWSNVANEYLRIDESSHSFELYDEKGGQSHFFQMNGRYDFLQVQRDLTARLEQYQRQYPHQQQQQQQQHYPTVDVPNNVAGRAVPPTSSTRTPYCNSTGATTFAPAPATPTAPSTNTFTPVTNHSAAGAPTDILSPQQVSEMFEKLKQFEMFARRLKELEKKNDIDPGFCLLPWRPIWAQRGDEDNNEGMMVVDEDKGETFQLPEDVYSMMATWNVKSKPFWTSIGVVFVFQMLLMILVVIDTLRDAEKGNPLNLPVNVEVGVRIAQGLAVIVTVISQDDLRVGIEGLFQGLPDGFRGHERFQGISKLQWHIAYMIRFLQGFVGLLASFILLMQANTVIDLLLNFLGVTFISDLDERFFSLAALGYLGNANLRCTKEISRAEFFRDETKHPIGKRGSLPWFRKNMHLFGVFAVLLAMLACYSTFIAQQMLGTYSVKSFLVEFGDETVPSLGLFNGCYNTDNSGERSSGRVVYNPLISKAGSQPKGGTFAFCSKMSRWTFYDSSTMEGYECEHYIVKSDITTTFDVLEAGKLQWYTEKDEPLESLKVTKTKAGQCYGISQSRVNLTAACKELELGGTLLDSRSQYYDLVESPHDTDPQDLTLSHAVYIGRTDLEVVLFTGRRWVITDADHLSSKLTNSTLTNVSDVEKYLFADKLFNVANQDENWVKLISEEVTSINDPGTPLGLRWYYPRYEEDYGYNFPAADLSRPYDAIFACAKCDDNSNPCNYGGTCQANGTCLCANGAFGELCREKPLGNGECNPYFNEAVFDFDGGDCCGSTCEGGLCGTPSSFNPFGLENVTVNAGVFDSYSRYESSMGIVAASGFVKRYACQDPKMATFTIEISNMEGAIGYFSGSVESIGCTFGSLSVRCDEILYLQTPALLFPVGSYQCNQSHVERVHVPYGTKCELAMVDPSHTLFYGFGYDAALYYGESTNSTAIWENPLSTHENIVWGDVFQVRAGGEIIWDVPSSKCLTDVLSNTTVDIFNESTAPGAAVNRLSADGLSDYQCTIDPDTLKERYFLTLLDQSVSFPSTAWDLHQCQGWGFPAVRIECNENNTVTSLAVSSTKERPEGGTLPTEVSFLSNLEMLDLRSANLKETIPGELGHLIALTFLSLRDNNFNGTIPTKLSHLTALSLLDLQGNDLTGTIRKELGDLTVLTSLDLSSNDLTGTIASELGKLTALTDFYLQENDLNGAIASELGRLAALTSLSLRGNNLNGTIPTELGNLTAMSELNLQYNDLSGPMPRELGRLTSLDQLFLHYNDLSGPIPSDLGSLTALERLELSFNDLNGTIPSELGRLTALTYLDLRFNYLSGLIPKDLGDLTALNYLYLNRNDLTGPVPIELIALKNSTSMSLSDNNLTLPTEIGLFTDMTEIEFNDINLGGSIPSQLGLITGLTRLALSINGGPIPSELGNLMSLNYLSLNSNDLNGLIPSELGNLQELRVLSLYNNNLNSSIPTQLGHLTALDILYLGENDLSGQIPSQLGNLTALDILYFGENDLSGQIPTQLGHLQQLKSLWLHENDLSGTIASELGNLTALTSLRLYENDLNGTIPKDLGHLMGLKDLRLDSNDLNGSIPSQLGTLQQLGVLSLHKNSLTGSIPEELGNLTALYEFSLAINDLNGPIPSELANVKGWPGEFPNASNAITINIRTDWNPRETSFEWSKRNESGLWQVLDVEDPAEKYTIHSYTKEVQAVTVYKLEITDTYGDGIRNGWFTVTNSTPSQDFDEGTLIWEASGSELKHSLVVFIWIDSNGHAQVVEHIAGEGFALEGDDVISAPGTDLVEKQVRVANTGSSFQTTVGGAQEHNIFVHD